ncbi:YveK family protein [Streptomyces lutosisoli]|uniref:YveK family protein n=1 Tax=Streptomyces lutosisoli TaxID=2665721 RepID=UPI00361837D0
MCLLLGIGTGEAVAVVSTPVYEARAQLFVATRTGVDTAELNQGQTFSQARVQSYAAIVATRQVTQPVVRELGLRYTPEELASRITAEAPLNTVLINITVRDTVPVRAARIADAVAQRFSTVVEKLETPKRAPASLRDPDESTPSLRLTRSASPSRRASPRNLYHRTGCSTS